MRNTVLHVARDHGLEGWLQRTLDVVRAYNRHATCARSTPLRSSGHVVIGAYGHSCVCEFFFGGVTRAMLRASSRALVMAR